MLQQRVAFPAHIESIETVVPGVKIAGVEKERLEGSPHRFARSGNRLHDHDPGSETMPVPASQHYRLVTLDVDFHEMDLAIGDVLLAQCSQRSGLGLEGSRCEPVTACLDQHCVVAARDAERGVSWKRTGPRWLETARLRFRSRGLRRFSNEKYVRPGSTLIPFQPSS